MNRPAVDASAGAAGLLVPPTSYRPTGFYFRRALRESEDPAKLRSIGFALCNEVELLRSFIYEQGLTPPKQNMMRSEAREKGYELEVTDERPPPFIPNVERFS